MHKNKVLFLLCFPQDKPIEEQDLALQHSEILQDEEADD
jgi:hypothetical protein